MDPIPQQAFLLAVAAGIGLLVGIERERRRGESPAPFVAGVRTFTLIGFTGGLAELLGGPAVALAGAFVVIAILASYKRTLEQDPGLTTEVAMLVVFLLGVLAMRMPQLAAALGAAVALLLAAKTRLHRFVREVLSEQELHDALLLAGCALVVLPLLPAGAVDPWGVLDLRRLWTLVVLVMAINAAGYVALRALGPRYGLAVAGFAGGFVSSTATIAGMGTRALQTPALVAACAGAGLMSSVATVLQLALLVGAMSPALLAHLALPLALTGLVALLTALLGNRGAFRDGAPHEELALGRAFQPLSALKFTALLALVLLGAAALKQWLGDAGAVAGIAVAGFADAHAGAAAAAQLVAAGEFTVHEAMWPVLAAFATNTLSKLGFAWATGGRAYALRLLPGLLAMMCTFAATALLIARN
jgi:uncharacterized membrane protein (DUF4010 family)